MQNTIFFIHIIITTAQEFNLKINLFRTTHLLLVQRAFFFLSFLFCRIRCASFSVCHRCAIHFASSFFYFISSLSEQNLLYIFTHPEAETSVVRRQCIFWYGAYALGIQAKMTTTGGQSTKMNVHRCSDCNCWKNQIRARRIPTTGFLVFMFVNAR